MLFPVVFFFCAALPDGEALRAGLKALADGDLKSARASLEKAKQAEPENPRVWLGLETVYARQHEASLAAQAADHALALAHAVPGWEERANVRNFLGKVYLAQGELEPALAEYRNAIRLQPYEEAFRFDLAQALLEQQRFRDAIDALEDARATFDKSAQIELALGVAYYGQRRFSDAIDAFLKTINLAPDVSQPYVFLGKMLDQAGERLPEIRRSFKQFAAANPENYLGYLLQAKAAAIDPSADSSEIEKLLRRSIALRNDSWESHYELGVLLENRRSFAEAASELEKSVRLNQDFAPIHYHLARVYDRLGRGEAAAREREQHASLTKQEKVTAGMEPVRRE